MKAKKLSRLRRELRRLRTAKYNLSASDLVGFAKKVGRFLNPHRGKEPTYVSVLPNKNPLSIPGHSTVNPYTADAILDVLEADLDSWQAIVEQQEKKDEDPEGLSKGTIRTNRDPGNT
jgi:hypothetical protein